MRQDSEGLARGLVTRATAPGTDLAGNSLQNSVVEGLTGTKDDNTFC